MNEKVLLSSACHLLTQKLYTTRFSMFKFCLHASRVNGRKGFKTRANEAALQKATPAVKRISSREMQANVFLRRLQVYHVHVGSISLTLQLLQEVM